MRKGPARGARRECSRLPASMRTDQSRDTLGKPKTEKFQTLHFLTNICDSPLLGFPSLFSAIVEMGNFSPFHPGLDGTCSRFFLLIFNHCLPTK